MSKRYSEFLIQNLNNEFGTKKDIVNAFFWEKRDSTKPSQ
jgi:hypothetical protein